MGEKRVRHLRIKLLMMFVAIGLLPFLTLLVYALYLGESNMLSKLKAQQFQEAQTIVKLINSHIESLQNEVRFIAALDVMDDILVGDIDKKISRLLTQKEQDLHHSITALALTTQGEVVAASKPTLLQTHFDTAMMKNTSGIYQKDKKLFIYTKTTASFDANKSLGYLFFIYNLDDLEHYLVSLPQKHSYLLNRITQESINNTYLTPLQHLKDETSSIIDNEHLIVYMPLLASLHNYSIIYAVDKSVALEVEYKFLRFMLFLAVIIVLVILYVAVRYSKEIVEPIQKLTHATQQIIEARNEQECIDISIAQIKKLTKTDVVYYANTQQRPLAQQYIELYVSDFETDREFYFGAIALGITAFRDENEKKFYDSLGQIIILQLDKIRLLERTLAASRAKSSFISSMSHELRTPLNSIIGFSQYMITCETLEEEHQDVMAKIESSAQYLLGMINDILDIAKIEAGKMELKVDEVEIEPLLEAIYAMLLPLTDDKEIQLQLHTEKLTQHTLRSDAKLIQQVVVNLLSNAIKFTSKGSIDVYASNDAEMLRIEVVDSGCGIAQEHLEKLFEDFAQLDNQPQQGQKGSGLGLSISKKIAQLLGGDITIASEGEGKGVCATFYCALHIV